MYLDFFGLEREPFHITPDPEFLFPSPSHKEAFATVMYGVQQQKGFVVVTGEVGTGKTTVLRAYLQKLKGSDIQPIYIFDPHLAFDELLEAVMTELGAPPHEGHSQFSRLQWLRHYLIDAYSAGKSVVLIIDEAQNMPVETLEQLRVLTNLETTKDKLLQVLLVGQPELEEKLALHQLRQLNQRVAVRATLRHLSDEEASDYVKHRVRHAGGTPESIFTSAALKAIVKHAKGNPRILNILCDNVLANAFGAQQIPIGVSLVKDVIKDISPTIRKPGPAFDWRHLAPVAAAASIALIAGAASMGLWQAKDPAEAASTTPMAQAPLPATTASTQEEAATEPQAAVAASVEAPAQTEAPAATAQEPAEERFDPQAIALEKLLERDRKVEEAAAAKAESPTAPPVLDAGVEQPPAEAVDEAPAPPAEVIVASGLLEQDNAKLDSASPAEPEAAEVSPAPVLDAAVEKEEVAPAAEPEPQAPSPTPVVDGAVEAATTAPAGESEASRPPAAAEAPAEAETNPMPAAPAKREAIKRDLAGAKQVQIVEGDTLIELLLRRYGKYNGEMVQQVQVLNPSITDPNHILAGNELLLPDFDNAEELAPGVSSPASN